MQRLGGLQPFNPTARDVDQPATILDTATGDLLTWQLLGTTNAQTYRLARIDVAGPTVTQTIEVPTPEGESRSIAASIVQIGADVVWNEQPGSRQLFRSNLDGSPASGTWLDISAEISAAGLPFAAGAYSLNVDSLGRLYVWAAANSTELNIFRYGPDGLFDRRFRLLPSLNGTSPSSRDACPSPNSHAHTDWPDPIGMDISADGTLAFVTMGRSLGVGDTSLQKQSIYKFDLATADETTFLASATVFAQIDSLQPGGDTETPQAYTIGPQGARATYAGLTVSSDGRVAAQVVTRTKTLVDLADPFDDEWRDDAQYWLYLYDADGTLSSTTHIADSVPLVGFSGQTLGSFTYRFKVESSICRNMTWNPDGSEVYYWINLDDAPGGDDPVSPPFQRTWLCDSSGKIGSHLISSDPDTQENPFGYALSFAAPVAGCTVNAHSGDVYSYLGRTTSDPKGDRIYRYDPSGPTAVLKEIIPVSYAHDAGFTGSTARVTEIHLMGGDLYLLCAETPVAGYTGAFPHLHPTVIKVSGASGHAATVLYDLDGESHGDRSLLGMTFDSTGNLYLAVQGANGSDLTIANSQHRGLFLYKLNAAGVLQWRRQLNADYDVSTNPNPWLADDDRTLLYMTYRGTLGDHHEGVRRYDVVADTQGSDWFALTSPFDAAPLVQYQTTTKGTFLLLPNNKAVIAVAPGGLSGNSIAESTVGYQGTGGTLYETGRLVGGFYDDEGMSIDADPDGVSLWIQSGNATTLNRFNLGTRALTKTLTIRDEGGSAYNFVPFAICGGPGGHGNPPPTVTPAARRIFGFVTSLNV